MYNIYDILEEINFEVVDENIECLKLYGNNKLVDVHLFIEIKGEMIFEYRPKYYEIYKGNFNKEAVEVTVKDILNDVERELKEQTGIKYMVSKAEKEWIKDKF
ncbi:hypothetical protein [Staphylococcus phage PT1-4]